jgi:tRNA G18 (ribose-2'-O)-methylase SpoU
LLCCGTAKLLHKVAREATLRQGEEANRDGEDDTTGKSDVPWFKVVNTLRHPLLRLKEEGYQVVGMEQTAASTSLYDFKFVRKTVLVIGSETRGLPPDILAVCDQGSKLPLFLIIASGELLPHARLLTSVVEIPLNGPPHSLNVASAAAIGLYEYCKQHPL